MATDRQKEAIDNVVKNGGNVSKGMREAGYSVNTAKTPKKLTDSKAWAELMDIYLPDDMLLRALSNDIKKKEGSRKGELELAYKLKGRMTEKQEVKIEHTLAPEQKEAIDKALNDM